MKKETLARISLTVVLFAAVALGGKAIHAAAELARVNGSVITLQDFEKRYKDNLKFFQFRAPTKKNVLEDIIKHEIGVQQAKKLGLDKDPEVVEQMNNVLYQAFLNKKLSKQFDAIQVTDDEAKDWYGKNPEVRTSHIFIAVRPDAKPADVAKAKKDIEDIYAKYVKPGNMSFAEVAQKYSEGAAAQMGGDIDWQTRDHLDPAYFAAVSKLSVGGVTGVVHSQFGFHIIKLTGKKGWDEVDRSMVKRLVFDERRQTIFEGFMTQLRKQANVVVNAELLKE